MHPNNPCRCHQSAGSEVLVLVKERSSQRGEEQSEDERDDTNGALGILESIELPREPPLCRLPWLTR